MPPDNNPQYPPGNPQQPQQPMQPGQQPVYPAASPAPTYPAPAAQEKEASPYDFFLESKQPKKKLLSAPKGGLNFRNILLLAVAFFVLLGILAIIMSAVRKSGPPPLSLTSVVISQQEIIRVSTLGEKKLEALSLKNFAATAQSTTMSEQQELITYIAKRGGKINPKALAAATDPQNDRVLNAAEASSTYDTAFRTTMQRMLTDHQVKMQELSDSATAASDKAILKKNINTVELLLEMLNP